MGMASEGKEACGVFRVIAKIVFVRQEVVHGLRQLFMKYDCF
jgi:hypothetical protein